VRGAPFNEKQPPARWFVAGRRGIFRRVADDDRLRDVPEPHRSFLGRCVDALAADLRIVGVAGGGSLVTGGMDAFSDLDLVVAVEPAAYPQVLDDRQRIAAGVGTLLASFTGDHVGEERLLICLYDAPLLHVDFKFVSLPDVAVRVEDPLVLWERDGRLTRALAAGAAEHPARSAQWIEDRFWVWVHYVSAHVGRGELFEALDALSVLHALALGPLALAGTGARPTGVRRLEQYAPDAARALSATVAGYDAAGCLAALRAAVDAYRTLRPAGVEDRRDAERAAVAYLADVERGRRNA